MQVVGDDDGVEAAAVIRPACALEVGDAGVYCRGQARNVGKRIGIAIDRLDPVSCRMQAQRMPAAAAGKVEDISARLDVRQEAFHPK